MKSRNEGVRGFAAHEAFGPTTCASYELYRHSCSTDMSQFGAPEVLRLKRGGAHVRVGDRMPANTSRFKHILGYISSAKIIPDGLLVHDDAFMVDDDDDTLLHCALAYYGRAYSTEFGVSPVKDVLWNKLFIRGVGLGAGARMIHDGYGGIAFHAADIRDTYGYDSLREAQKRRDDDMPVIMRWMLGGVAIGAGSIVATSSVAWTTWKWNTTVNIDKLLKLGSSPVAPDAYGITPILMSSAVPDGGTMFNILSLQAQRGGTTMGDIARMKDNAGDGIHEYAEGGGMSKMLLETLRSFDPAGGDNRRLAIHGERSPPVVD